ILHGGCRPYPHHQGEPTFQAVARTLPLSPRPASSCFSTCTKIVQLLFLPVRTNIHKFTAARTVFQNPVQNPQKNLHLSRRLDGAMPQKVARRFKKIRRAKSFDPVSSIFSKTTSPSIATISPLAKPVSPSNAAPLLEGGVPRCGFEGALPGNSAPSSFSLTPVRISSRKKFRPIVFHPSHFSLVVNG